MTYVGNLVMMLELPWALAWHGVAPVSVSQFGEDQLLLRWGDRTASTSELIGEDSLRNH